MDIQQTSPNNDESNTHRPLLFPIFAVSLGTVLLINGLIGLYHGGGLLSAGLVAGACGWFMVAVVLDPIARKDLFG